MSTISKLTAGLFVAGVVYASAVPATAVPRKVEASVAQGKTGKLLDVEVYPGYGMTISFLPVRERIVNVWVDDMNRFAAPTFNRPLCSGTLVSSSSNNVPGNQMTATNGQGPQVNNACQPADVVHLRRSTVRPFPGMSSSPTGRTLLTLITEPIRGGTQTIYQFNLIPRSTGNPRWTSLSIVPDNSPNSNIDVIPAMLMPRAPNFRLPPGGGR
jgi:hypothetical protein